MKLYFGDLPCYQNLTLDVMLRPSYEPDASFDLSRMPNESLRQAFAAFIFDRASSLSYSSLRSEATHFHNFAHFCEWHNKNTHFWRRKFPTLLCRF